MAYILLVLGALLLCTTGYLYLRHSKPVMSRVFLGVNKKRALKEANKILEESKR